MKTTSVYLLLMVVTGAPHNTMASTASAAASLSASSTTNRAASSPQQQQQSSSSSSPITSELHRKRHTAAIHANAAINSVRTIHILHDENNDRHDNDEDHSNQKDCESLVLLSRSCSCWMSCRGGGARGVKGKAVIVQNKNRSNSLDVTADSATAAATEGLKQRLKIGFYFGLWYALNVIYNIMNKKLLNILPAPVTVGTIQLGIGGLYAILLWMTRLRRAPILTAKGKELAWKVGTYHGSGQLFSMVSLGAGPVSFTHIVKALEPFFSAMISGLVFGKWMKPQVYATLVPVVGGVGYACLKERSFSWLAFWMAMWSNLSFALRAVVSKTGMNSGSSGSGSGNTNSNTNNMVMGEHMNAVNLFAVVTIASFVLCTPVAWLVENDLLLDLWAKATTGPSAVSTHNDLVKSVILSGLFHYLNNEVMYLALSNVHPVTLAVGNTMKRVFIMVASVLVFRNPVSLQAGIGSAIGIAGVLLYSLVKQYYENLERLEQEELRQKKDVPLAVVGRRMRKQPRGV